MIEEEQIIKEPSKLVNRIQNNGIEDVSQHKHNDSIISAKGDVYCILTGAPHVHSRQDGQQPMTQNQMK